MKRELIIGTGNRNKLKELQALLKGLNIRVIPVTKFKKLPHIVENGKTFKANAEKKARLYSRLSDSLTLADDSGLCVNDLKGAPGLYSARYAGPGCTYADNNRKLLRVLSKKKRPKRIARFHCAVALYIKGKKIKVVEKTCSGRIAKEIRGKQGFGYDPLFIPKGFKKSFAELKPTQKNRISHRGKALAAIKTCLKTYFKP